ncbi:MAG: class I SAM-dependent methyltransferase [Candidatus Thorarchaeota archaeon]|nr:MAG: class I SAM-dependent methyltransferase [Candidatus Thorarchaeota archaeon]
MATILMRLTEERAANQYDRWIGLLTLGQASAMRNYLLDSVVPRRGRVLDLGCGTGQLLVEAGRRGATGVGVDLNPRMLKLAQERCRRYNLKRRLRFFLGSALSLDIEAHTFDIVVSTLLISELQPKELERLLQEAARMVKPGGLVAIGGEGEVRAGLIGAFTSMIRRASFWIVSKLTTLISHPHHRVAQAMKNAGLNPRYKVSFLQGMLVLFVAEAEK